MKKLICILLCLIFIFSLSGCKTAETSSADSTASKEEAMPTPKTATFAHVKLEYDFTIPAGLSCIVDNNDKQTIWMYETDGNVSQWQILITLEPATKEEFEKFHMEQRSYIISQQAEEIKTGRYLYEYDTDEETAKIYGIAEYDEATECIVYLRALDEIDTAVSIGLLDNAKLTKTE